MSVIDLQVPATVADKFKRLLESLQTCRSLLVAFSGGVDSTLLLAAAQRVLRDRVIAVTARFAVHPVSETRYATRLAENLGVRHLICDSGQMSSPDFIANAPDRCYVCKDLLFGQLSRLGRELGTAYIAQGTNRDDLADYRPGMRAAERWNILAPLLSADLRKSEIRQLSHALGLPNWDRPAASCLATRIPYGTPITAEKLQHVERAEAVLHELGFSGFRVRHHGTVARIEVLPTDFGRLLEAGPRQQVISALKKIGFRHVAMDLEGYVYGSMNRDIG